MRSSIATRLRRAGVSDEQIDALAEFADEELATRGDLTGAEERLTVKIEQIRGDLTLKIERLRSDLLLKLGDFRVDLLKTMLILGAAQIGAIVIGLIVAVFTIYRLLSGHS